MTIQNCKGCMDLQLVATKPGKPGFFRNVRICGLTAPWLLHAGRNARARGALSAFKNMKNAGLRRTGQCLCTRAMRRVRVREDEVIPWDPTGPLWSALA